MLPDQVISSTVACIKYCQIEVNQFYQTLKQEMFPDDTISGAISFFLLMVRGEKF
jgi:hypothetical protein